MTYLLDTNACTALINGSPEQVRRRFERECAAGAAMATSSITVFELWYGVRKSQRREANQREPAAQSDRRRHAGTSPSTSRYPTPHTLTSNRSGPLDSFSLSR